MEREREEEAVPLKDHPIFKKLRHPSSGSGSGQVPVNLIAYDGSSRLYAWNRVEKRVHYVSITQPLSSLDPESTLFATSQLKTIELDVEVEFLVRHLAINRKGRSLALFGDEMIVVVDLASQFLDGTTTLNYCRATTVGKEKFYSSIHSKALRILQVLWHPYSDTHLGILSSDGVFRLFDLSVDTENPEQEYHLQSGLSGRYGFVTYSRPVSFVFGGEHLWERFSVFFLFSNGHIYVICPVVPFRSLFSSSSVEELHKDVLALQSSISMDSSSSSEVAKNRSLGVAWLESVFPCMANNSGSAIGHHPTSLVLKSHAHAPFDASLVLQGPLPVIMAETNSSDEDDDGMRATMLLYNIAYRDSILAISSTNGQMQIFVLADEVQPVWNSRGTSPRITVDDQGNLLSVGMLAEAIPQAHPSIIVKPNSEAKPNQMGPPPLLQLAVVDFALSAPVLEAAPICILPDPIVPERMYCHHGAGLDAVLLQLLPFSDQSSHQASFESSLSSSSSSSSSKLPVVYPLLDMCPGGAGESSVPSPLLGLAQVLDTLGDLWLVAITSLGECAVIPVKPHRLSSPLYLDAAVNSEQGFGTADVSQVISKELLLGPKDIPIPQVPSSRTLTVDSLEGRTFLHDQCKLLREKYIEYAHRVHVELSSHGMRLRKVVGEQAKKLEQSQGKLLEASRESESLACRLQNAHEKNRELERRIKKLNVIQGVKQRPLTTAEEEFKHQLDVLSYHDVDILHSAVSVLQERFERYLRLSQASSNRPPSRAKMGVVPDAQMGKLKGAVNQLIKLVGLAAEKVKEVDEIVKKRELLNN